MPNPGQVAGFIAATPQSAFWPGLSSITQTFENFFSPTNAVEIGGQSAPTDARGVFTQAAKMTASAVLGPAANLAVPAAVAATDEVSAASASAGRALDSAESVLENAGNVAKTSVEKITSGLEWGLIAIGIVIGLWVIAQASLLIPRKP